MRPARSRFRLATVLLILVLSGSAVGRLEAQTGGTLVIGLDQEPPTLDPHASPSAVSYQIIASVTENLLFRGPDGKLVPWLAESWTTAKDGRSATFKLRRDVKFHDGTQFNAESVKFNFDRIPSAWKSRTRAGCPSRASPPSNESSAPGTPPRRAVATSAGSSTR